MNKFYIPTPLKNQQPKVIFGALFFMWIIGFNTSFAQVVINEGYEGVQFMPFGWYGGKITGSDVNNYVERTTTGGAPACTPQAGTAMMRYRSASIFVTGEKYFVSSARYDLTANPGTAYVNFQMYHDNGSSGSVNDYVSVYMNDSASANASFGSMTLVSAPILRYSATVGWALHNFVIPAGYNNTKAYVILVFSAHGGSGLNMYIDNFNVQTWPSAMTYVSSQLSYQETSDVGKGQNNQLVVGIKITTNGAASPILIDSINFNANGTTAPGADVVAASVRLWYTKGTNAFVMNANQFGAGATASSPWMKFTQAGFPLENGDNYFWLTYSTTVGAGSGNYIDADFQGINAYPASISNIPGARQIDVALCNGIIPTLTVGTSWLGGSYTQNDYVNRSYLRGENFFNASYPYIDNNINAVVLLALFIQHLLQCTLLIMNNCQW